MQRRVKSSQVETSRVESRHGNFSSTDFEWETCNMLCLQLPLLLPAAFHIIIFDQIGNYVCGKKNAIVCHSQRPQKKHATRTGRNMCFLPCPRPYPSAPPTPLAVYMICGSSTNAASGKRNLRNRNRKFSDGQLRCWSRRCHRPSWLPGCLPATQCLLPAACHRLTHI